MEFTRRHFLKTAGATLAATLAPFGRAGRAWAADDKVLIALFLRGGADGLNIVVPAGDTGYYDLRPNIALREEDLVDLDGFFALNRDFAALMPAYDAGDLAFLHAAGSPDDTRSHFDAQDLMERGAAPGAGVFDGWLARYLEALGTADAYAGISLGSAKAKSLTGTVQTLAMSSLGNFKLSVSYGEARRAAIESMYRRVSDTLVGRATGEILAAIDTVSGLATETGVAYPNSSLGRAMRDAAALVRAGIGVRTIAVDRGGWDHHDDELREMESSGADLAASLAAFHEDLGPDLSKALVLVMTEFGRTAEENGSRGTDHGHGSVMMALGGGLSGGRVIVKDGAWPGLDEAGLDRGRFLAVTTDFRDVFAEALDRHMGFANPGALFPGHTVSAANYPGLLG